MTTIRSLSTVAVTLTFDVASFPALHVTDADGGAACRVVADSATITVEVGEDTVPVTTDLLLEGTVSRRDHDAVSWSDVEQGEVVVDLDDEATIPEWLDGLIDRTHAAAAGADMMLRAAGGR